MKNLLILGLLFTSILFADNYLTPNDLVKKANQSIQKVEPKQLHQMFTKNILLIDVREKYETFNGQIEFKNNINIPRGLLEWKVGTYNLPSYEAVVIYCQAGARGALATKTLQEMGYKNVYNLIGGYKKWDEECGPIETFDNIQFETSPKTKKETKNCIKK